MSRTIQRSSDLVTNASTKTTAPNHDGPFSTANVHANRRAAAMSSERRGVSRASEWGVGLGTLRIRACPPRFDWLNKPRLHVVGNFRTTNNPWP